MWAWLNPLNWIKVFSYLKMGWDLLIALYQAWQKRQEEKKQQEVREQQQAAESALEQANQIKDDNERLEAKAEAACKLERSINPRADCD